MSILTLLLLSALAIAVIVTAIRLFVALKQNFKTGNAVRVDLSKKIESVRFGKMLKKRDIDLNRFIHVVRLTEIESGMRSCQSCNKTASCDKTLVKENSESGDFQFCPNTQFIEQRMSV